MIYPLRNKQIRVLDVFIHELKVLHSRGLTRVVGKHKNGSYTYDVDWLIVLLEKTIDKMEYSDIEKPVFNRLRKHFVWGLSIEFGMGISTAENQVNIV